jgi:hypothetical protein
LQVVDLPNNVPVLMHVLHLQSYNVLLLLLLHAGG